jgi:hypothetical protein
MDPTTLLTNAAAFQLGVAAFKSALAAQASVLQLFQAIPLIPAQAGQPGQVTASLGNTVNIAV